VLRSTAKVVGYCDADLSTPPEAIRAGLELLDGGWDVVLGSRYCAGAGFSVEQPWVRRSGSWAFRRASRRYVGAISDTQCGFKLFKGDVARSVFDGAKLSGFAFDVEIVARALRSGFAVTELPVTWKDEAGSTFRPLKDGISSFRDLAALHRALAGAP
jgi:glycosyltransferase involved in cell wall biosynthesis